MARQQVVGYGGIPPYPFQGWVVSRSPDAEGGAIPAHQRRSDSRALHFLETTANARFQKRPVSWKQN
jgi:hypothetical protein